MSCQVLGVQFSRDFIRAFNDRLNKLRENRGLLAVLLKESVPDPQGNLFS